MYPVSFTKSMRKKNILVDNCQYEYRYKNIQRNVTSPTTYWDNWKFKTEDSLARAKLQELVNGRSQDSHPSRSNERNERLRRKKEALAKFDPTYLKEFVYGMRNV